MVVTGFIFAHIVGDAAIDVPKFYLNRALRIYPLYVLLVTLGYLQVADHGPLGAATYWLALLPLPGAVTNEPQIGTYALAMWSLSIELQFYLLFPFLYPRMRAAGTKGIALLLIGLIGLRWFVWDHDGSVHRLAYSTLFGGLDCFLAGMLGADLYGRAKQKKISVPWYVPLGMLLFMNIAIYVIYRTPGFWHVNWGSKELFATSASRLWVVWPTVAAVLCTCLAISYLLADFRMPRVLNRLLDWLGTISYSIYGWHNAVIPVAFTIIAPGAWATAYVYGLIAVIATIPVAALSYYLIERPFLSMRVRYLRTSGEAAGATDKGR
jgi:peptidoglycan/LPS O-acetylase OafA/YrhL